jgi:hypothetical protein
MTTAHRIHRLDANHAAVVDALLAAGVRVQSLASVGAGCPDLLCSKDGETWLVEVKAPSEKLNDAQARWHKTWAGRVVVAHSPEDALKGMER